MKIELKNRQKKYLKIPAGLIKIIRTILTYEGIKDADLSVTFVSPGLIRSINKRYLNHDYATDVLAFDLSHQKLSYKSKGKVWRIDGEIIISPHAAMGNAAAFKTTFREELILYIVHGILHLLGHADHNELDKKRMRAREKKIMAHLTQRISRK